MFRFYFELYLLLILAAVTAHQDSFVEANDEDEGDDGTDGKCVGEDEGMGIPPFFTSTYTSSRSAA